jgi:hypothetical protein
MVMTMRKVICAAVILCSAGTQALTIPMVGSLVQTPADQPTVVGVVCNEYGRCWQTGSYGYLPPTKWEQKGSPWSGQQRQLLNASAA